MSQAKRAEGVDPGTLQERLFDLWMRRDLEALRLVVLAEFSQMPHPLAGLLALLEACPDVQKGRSPTLGQVILAEFVRWRRGCPELGPTELGAELTEELQRRALGLISDRQPSYMERLIDLFQLRSLPRGVVLEHVQHLQDSCCYKEAALLSVKLELQEDLEMEKMCVPLILMDKLPLAEAYVQGNAKLQERLVELLDSWCSPDFRLDELRRSHH